MCSWPFKMVKRHLCVSFYWIHTIFTARTLIKCQAVRQVFTWIYSFIPHNNPIEHKGHYFPSFVLGEVNLSKIAELVRVLLSPNHVLFPQCITALTLRGGWRQTFSFHHPPVSLCLVAELSILKPGLPPQPTSSQMCHEDDGISPNYIQCM